MWIWMRGSREVVSCQPMGAGVLYRKLSPACCCFLTLNELLSCIMIINFLIDIW